MTTNIVNVSSKTVRQRVATAIWFLYQKFGVNEEGYLDIMVTREEIANMSATTTESAIRFISEFNKDKVIRIDKKQIQVLDFTKLSKIAGE